MSAKRASCPLRPLFEAAFCLWGISHQFLLQWFVAKGSRASKTLGRCRQDRESSLLGTGLLLLPIYVLVCLNKKAPKYDGYENVETYLREDAHPMYEVEKVEVGE